MMLTMGLRALPLSGRCLPICKQVVSVGILFLFAGCVHGIARDDATNTTFNLTSMLDGYESKLRPGSGGGPVQVDLGIQVESLSSISETTMDFSVTMFLREYWMDRRLQTNFTSQIILKGNDVDLVWAPDIFFLHEKSAKLHDVTVSNKLMYIRPNGSVCLSLRVSATLACHMSLEHFPMDSQTCTIHMMSYAYDSEEMKLTLDENNVYMADLMIPRFELLGFHVREDVYKFATDFSSVQIILKLERQMVAYLLTVYIPSVLLVVIAWLSFWIDARAAPARVTLGITTVLTVTTMTSGILESLPIVTYAKAIDIWLAACLLFVFLCLLEFAWANYLVVLETRRAAKRKSKKTKKKKNGKNGGGADSTACDGGADGQTEQDPLATSIEMELLLGEKHFTALHLDKISRWGFPIGFIIFNLIYWPYYLYAGDRVLWDLRKLTGQS